MSARSLSSERSIVFWLVTAALAACEPPRSHEYDEVETPVPAPEPLPPLPDRPDQPPEAGDVAKCGRGTGRTAEGVCVPLAVDEASYGQRVQIPSGNPIIGFIPHEGYDARPARGRPAVRWSGNPPRHADVASFFIDLTEVPVAAYQKCVDAGQCSPAACPDGTTPSTSNVDAANRLRDELPQTCVTHEQAEAFCRAHGGRLPTEAEWEYAARGVDARIYPWGNVMKDEFVGMVPVARTLMDASYFGIFGLGSNVMEWVADTYQPDAGLAGFVTEFRRASGPVARTRADFERQLACGDPPAAGCSATRGEPLRHVVKGSISGARYAARASVPAHPPAEELEGWKTIAHGNDIGFRCAADLREGQRPLTVPTPAPVVPAWLGNGTLDVFGGVAEAVDRDEARAFCSRLSVASGERKLEDWRLPTLAEIQALAEIFKGPGPFWTKDGAADQEDAEDSASPWVVEDTRSGDALAARCVRDSANDRL